MPEISQEELDMLRAGQPATVTIDAAEYKRLKAAANGIDPVLHQRIVQRLGEVERQLRIELDEHQAEMTAMSKRLEHK